MIEPIIALTFLVIISPFLGILYFLVKLTSPGPFFFKQKRAGKNKKPFTMYKIRTMVQDAENQRLKIKDQNEANGPVFKIRNDPRYTKIGKFLSHTAIDELPQLINIFKGEMSFVGPRPLPIDEANKIPKKYERRFSVLPGMTSSWIIRGAHKLTFKKWMELDLEYLKKKSFFYDLSIFIKTIITVLKLIFKKIFDEK